MKTRFYPLFSLAKKLFALPFLLALLFLKYNHIIMDWVGDAKKLEIISYVIVVLSILYSITVVRDFYLYFKKEIN